MALALAPPLSQINQNGARTYSLLDISQKWNMMIAGRDGLVRKGVSWDGTAP
jgi:hypothetical protein